MYDQRHDGDGPATFFDSDRLRLGSDDGRGPHHDRNHNASGNRVTSDVGVGRRGDHRRHWLNGHPLNIGPPTTGPLITVGFATQANTVIIRSVIIAIADIGGECVQPDLDQIAACQYPLAEPVYLYSGRPVANPAVGPVITAFIELLPEHATATGIVPASASDLDAARATFNDLTPRPRSDVTTLPGHHRSDDLRRLQGVATHRSGADRLHDLTPRRQLRGEFTDCFVSRQLSDAASKGGPSMVRAMDQLTEVPSA
jgi:hypothetical protein